MLVARTLVFLLVAISFSALSEERQPSEPVSNGGAQKSTPIIGSEKNPVFISAVPGEIEKKEAQALEEERKEKKESDSALVGWTKVLAWIAGLQFAALVVHAIIFGVQSKRLRQTIESDEKGERAYIFAEVVLNNFINSAMAGPSQFGRTEATVKFWNYGKTPAVITLIRGYVIPLENTPHELINSENSEQRLPPSLGISTNCVYPVDISYKITTSELADIRQLIEHSLIYDVTRARPVSSTPR